MSVIDRAIAWKWPTARAVVAGGVVTAWEGPPAQPTPSEIADALTEFQALVSTALLTEETVRLLHPGSVEAALIWAMIETYDPPASVGKFMVFRAKFISARRLHPWIPGS